MQHRPVAVSPRYTCSTALRETIPPRLAGLADSYGMILVFPDGRDSWYWDSPVDKSMQMESAITCDVVPYIDRHFPTVADREHRAITGLSMGGHGSLWLASRHPDIWGNAGSMSGGVNILPFPKSWRMSERLGAYETNKEVWKKHSVINNIDAIKAAKLNIIFDCGADDFFAGVNEDLHKRLRGQDTARLHIETRKPLLGLLAQLGLVSSTVL